jgi:acyl-CoA thioesterase-1
MRILSVLLLVASTVGHADTLLVMGDSISAAYGLDKEQGWVALLEKRLHKECPDLAVKNASVSGETSAGGAARLPPLLADYQVELLIIELGGNDGLRGLPPQQLKTHLREMIRAGRQEGAAVILVGIRIPPNYGQAYTQLFEKAFQQVADDTGVTFVPRMLEGVAGNNDLMQADGIHPKAEAQQQLLDNLWPAIAGKLECANGA